MRTCHGGVSFQCGTSLTTWHLKMFRFFWLTLGDTWVRNVRQSTPGRADSVAKGPDGAVGR